jgi:hypothetical protein
MSYPRAVEARCRRPLTYPRAVEARCRRPLTYPRAVEARCRRPLTLIAESRTQNAFLLQTDVEIPTAASAWARAHVRPTTHQNIKEQ